MEINKIYNENQKNSSLVLKDINLTIKNSEVVIINRVSGSGKSTLLNIIAGFEKANSGSLKINEQIIFNKKINIEP